MSSDTEYFLRRLQAERRAAADSSDRRVRDVHLEFAANYAARLRELGSRERRSTLSLVEAA